MKSNLLKQFAFVTIAILSLLGANSCKKNKNIVDTTPKVDSTLVTLYNTVTINNQYPGGAAFVDLDKGELYDMTSADYPDAIDHQDKIDAVYLTPGVGITNMRILTCPKDLCGFATGSAANLCSNSIGIMNWSIKNTTQFSLTNITYNQLLQIKYNFQLDSAYNKAIQESPNTVYTSVSGFNSGDVYLFKTNLGKGLFVVSSATGTDNTLGELIISILYLKDK